MKSFFHRSSSILRMAYLSVVARTSVTHRGVRLPPPQLRFCGSEFKDNEYYLDSAYSEVDRLVNAFGLGTHSSVLDIGCGPGRLAIGLQQRFPHLRSYLGVDVHGPSIRWCQRHLTRHKQFRFLRLGMRNRRYNPECNERYPTRVPRSDCPNGSVDVVNLFSVFSHLPQDDIEFYLQELSELVAPGGAVFLTAFLNPKASQPVLENPATEGRAWAGPLHCVQLDSTWFEQQVFRSGFTTAYGPVSSEVDGQTAVYLRRVSGS